MAQTVRPSVMLPAIERLHQAGDYATCAWPCHWPKRSMQRKKKASGIGMWPYLLNILQNGISHLEGERKLLNALTLESPNSNLLVDPVDIVQGEPADFSNSQTIDSQKQD